MGDIVKVCEVHGDLTAEKCIKRINYKQHGKPFYWKCRACVRQHYKEQYLKHQEKKKSYARAYHDLNKEERNAYKKEYREKNSTRTKRTKAQWNEVKKDYVAEYNKRQADDMSDGYVRSLLAKNSKGLKNKDVNIPALIEIKRATLIIKRGLRDSKDM